MAKAVTIARLQLENRREQQRGFLLELDSLIDWLTQFINGSASIDRQVESEKLDFPHAFLFSSSSSSIVAAPDRPCSWH
jgi:hypothetical protein